MAVSRMKSLLSICIALSALIALYAMFEIRGRKDTKTVYQGDKSPEHAITSGPESIERGRSIFDLQCRFCHDTASTETAPGPGLKDILKNKRLPASNRLATPENIIRQLKEPLNRMPSFGHLTDEEIADIISFLNTL